MERTVPYTASEEVELYSRTYYSLLRTSDAVQIRSLEEVHAGMNSLLHQHARDRAPDMTAFIYALLRLPDCVRAAREIVLGQSGAVFKEAGMGNVWDWVDDIHSGVMPDPTLTDQFLAGGGGASPARTQTPAQQGARHPTAVPEAVNPREAPPR